MRKNLIFVLVLVLAMAVLVACGGGAEDAADTGGADDVAAIGNAANGDDLYNSAVIGDNNAPGCITCHSLDEGVVIVGPSHAGLANRAADYTEGQTAEEYLRESIVEPNAHIVEGFTPDVMYQNYATDLTEQQIDDLVAYMLTLD